MHELSIHSFVLLCSEGFTTAFITLFLRSCSCAVLVRGVFIIPDYAPGQFVVQPAAETHNSAHHMQQQ